MSTSVLRVIALLMLPGLASAGSFIGLGDLPGGRTDSVAFGISADGTTAVGYGINSVGGSEAFRWTSNDGMVGLGVMSPLGGSIASAASADGSVIVGYDYNLGAFRWTSGGGMTSLWSPTTSIRPTDALGVSADGNVITGIGHTNWPANSQAYRWTSDSGAAGVGDFSVQSVGLGMSADGLVVVGGGATSDPGSAFRWTTGGGMEALGYLPNAASPTSVARGASADGSIVVGASAAASGQWEAFRWSSGGGMAGLGLLPNWIGSYGNAVNYDGSVIVGMVYRSPNGDYEQDAFVWTEVGGIQSLFDVLVANGATGLTGWTLREAYSVSADGMWIAGEGINPLGQREAFVANISPVPIPAAVWLFGSALGLMGAMRRKISIKSTTSAE